MYPVNNVVSTPLRCIDVDTALFKRYVSTWYIHLRKVAKYDYSLFIIFFINSLKNRIIH